MMPPRPLSTLPVVLGLLLTASGYGAEGRILAVGVPLEAGEAERWTRWLIPRPKSIRFRQKIRLRASDLSFRLRRGAGDIEKAAVEELKAFIAAKTGTKKFGEGFHIHIGVCDAKGRIGSLIQVPGAEKLASLKNSDQAYAIGPKFGLAVAALTERGVYHGVKTLQQLLEPHLAPGVVTVPMCEILDWPDLAERGQWGGSAYRDIPWLADRKMNLIEAHSRLSLDDQGRGVATIRADLQRKARLHGIKWVPVITHLDLLARTGIYERFPQLKGKGSTATHPTLKVQAPCFAEPKMAEILADWFLSLAATEGVEDICVWLSEHHVRCGCDHCKAKGQYALEAEACVRAWQLARRKHPKVRLRILLTQGSYETNDKVLAAASPPEVGVTYYHGSFTYKSSRDPMIYPLLADFARKGRWLGCYPQLTASWRVVCPWSGPQFIKFRMTEFADKGLACLCGYAPPDNRCYDFNMTAAAEWSWNAHGRSEREFALAWATRRRLREPEKAADWAVLLGPVGWDVYGSGIPYPELFGDAARHVRERPKLGDGFLRYFPTAEHIEEDLAACDRAMTLAKAVGDPAIVGETRAIRGYVRMVKSIHAIGTAIAGKKSLSAAEARALQATFDELGRAEFEIADGLKAWHEAVKAEGSARRFVDTFTVTHDAAEAIAKALAPFGIKDTTKPYRPHKVGGWHESNFDEKPQIQKRLDVTEWIAGPGTYRVRFAYKGGWWGLTMHAAALATAAPSGPQKLAEVASDRHTGTTAHRNKANTYLLKLATYDPKARYFLVVDIKGASTKGLAANRRGCRGDIWMTKARTRPPS